MSSRVERGGGYIETAAKHDKDDSRLRLHAGVACHQEDSQIPTRFALSSPRRSRIHESVWHAESAAAKTRVPRLRPPAYRAALMPRLIRGHDGRKSAADCVTVFCTTGHSLNLNQQSVREMAKGSDAEGSPLSLSRIIHFVSPANPYAGARVWL